VTFRYGQTSSIRCADLFYDANLRTDFGKLGRDLPGDAVKIGCHCGATISDSTDSLAAKGHLIPDQALYSMWDGIDDKVIDPVASGQLTVNDAYMVSRNIMSAPTRLMWQCFVCGRLYIDGRDGKLNCYVPDSDETDKQILRGH
jgi:hypothetical protein